jgi:deazaflavin-dependent oxidoreductase (nitroreductase family)
MTSDDYCYLSTIGRRTGGTHRIEIWYARAGDTLYLLAGGGRGADWVRNLEAAPKVTVELDGVTRAATARVIAGDPEESEARRLVFDKYQPRYDGDLTSWRASALPVALDLDE